MISASHNPMPDNGIKFFARGGHKLADEVEEQIEARLDEGWQRPIGANVGRVVQYDDALGDYVEHLLSCTPNRLNGLRVVVDTGNGAAAGASPRALRRMGAEVLAIHSSPDGYNINEGCGSTHMADLREAVVEHGYDVGIAHDGDADRCLAVDAQGNVVDGDEIMAILALAMRDQGKLAQDTVVATVMSNLGFKLAMRDAGITMVETGVGDRYVLEAMRAHDYTLGGEQSGHVVLLDYGTTGDGTLTALHLLARMADTRTPLAELASVMTKLPQVLINVRDVDRAAVGTAPGLASAVVGRRGPARGDRPGPAAPERDRATGAGHGGGAHGHRGPDRGRGAGRSRGPGDPAVVSARGPGPRTGRLPLRPCAESWGTRVIGRPWTSWWRA